MNESEREALTNVISYLWADEKKHAECEGNPDSHICRELQVLQDYLAVQPDNAMKALARRGLEAMQFGVDGPVLDEYVSLGLMEKVHGGAYGWTEKGKQIRAACGFEPQA